MDFFLLDPSPNVRRHDWVTDVEPEDGFNVGEAPHCSACGQCTGMREWLPPYRVTIEVWGTGFGDFAFWCDMLVSERVAQAYRVAALRGLSCFGTVEVLHVRRRGRTRAPTPRYFKVDVCLGGAAIDLVASGFEWDRPPTCPVCRLGRGLKRWARIVLEENTWTGEDVFMPRGLPGTYMVTAKFKEFCEVHGFRNAVFIPAEQAGHDYYPWERQEGGGRGSAEPERK